MVALPGCRHVFLCHYQQKAAKFTNPTDASGYSAHDVSLHAAGLVQSNTRKLTPRLRRSYFCLRPPMYTFRGNKDLEKLFGRCHSASLLLETPLSNSAKVKAVWTGFVQCFCGWSTSVLSNFKVAAPFSSYAIEQICPDNSKTRSSSKFQLNRK